MCNTAVPFGRPAFRQRPLHHLGVGVLRIHWQEVPEAKQRFALKGFPTTAIAAILRPGHGTQPPSFATLTTAPGPDVAPYDSRQVIVLRPEG
jgi:putative SOS response-associated peptidase YedK